MDAEFARSAVDIMAELESQGVPLREWLEESEDTYKSSILLDDKELVKANKAKNTVKKRQSNLRMYIITQHALCDVKITIPSVSGMFKHRGKQQILHSSLCITENNAHRDSCNKIKINGNTPLMFPWWDALAQ